MSTIYVCPCGRNAEIRTTRASIVVWLCPDCFIKLRGQDWWKEYVR